MQIEPKRRYRKEQIMSPLDESFKNIPEAMNSLYSHKTVMVNSESQSDNISPAHLSQLQMNHLNQKLSLKKEDCDKTFIGINNFKFLEGWLEDQDRIEPYKDAIFYNKYKFENRLVYDINSPYGMFGMFALQNKAAFVIATCQKNFSSYVHQIYLDNGFAENQFLIIEDTLDKLDTSKLDPEKAQILERIKREREIDVILGEWHGTVLTNSKVIRSVISVRDNFLKSSGFVFPNKGQLVLNFIEDGQYYEERFGFWDEVYGFNMRNVKHLVYQEAYLDYCTKNMLKTFDHVFYSIDLNKISTQDLNHVANFSCKVKQDSFVHAAVVNFKIFFEDCHHSVKYSNSSFDKKINFSQCILYLQRPFKVRKGTKIEGKFAFLVDLQNNEKMKFKLLVKYKKNQDRIQYYHLD